MKPRWIGCLSHNRIRAIFCATYQTEEQWRSSISENMPQWSVVWIRRAWFWRRWFWTVMTKI
jgi:hypothetical protein